MAATWTKSELVTFVDNHFAPEKTQSWMKLMDVSGRQAYVEFLADTAENAAPVWYTQATDWDDRTLFIESIFGCARAVSQHQLALANRIQKEGPVERTAHLKCLLLFGAERDPELVRFVVEKGGVSRKDILEQNSSYGWKTGSDKRALTIAWDSHQKQVFEYLLEDWIELPLTLDRDQTHHVNFDSKNYFKGISEKPIMLSEFDSHLDRQWATYFWERYRRRRGVNASSMDLLLSDRNFLASSLRYQENPARLKVFWELYGHDPALFDAMAKWALAVPFSIEPFLFAYQPEPLRESNSRFWLSWACHNPKLFIAVSLISTVQTDWGCFVDWLMENGLLSNGKNPFLTLPFQRGLQHVCQDMYRCILERGTAEAVEFMSKLKPRPQEPFEHSSSGYSFEEQIPEINFFIASAGSGKTQSMLNALENNFGFYLISGAAIRQAQRREDLVEGEWLYGPRTGGASADTELLFQTYEDFQNNPHSIGNRSQQFQQRCLLLLASRMIFFFRADSIKPFEPWRWLRFQLRRTQMDYHGVLFKLLVLSETRAELLPDSFQRQWPRVPEILGAKISFEWPKVIIGHQFQFLWCIDEVQCEMSTCFDTNDPLDTTFSALIKALSRFSVPKSAIIAGTALDLPKIERFVEHAIKVSTLMGSKDQRPIKSGRPVLVNTDDDFKTLLRAKICYFFDFIQDEVNKNQYQSTLGSILLGKSSEFDSALSSNFLKSRLFSIGPSGASQETIAYFNKANRWTNINKHRVILRGRIRWSVCYIEELFRAYANRGELEKSAVCDASQKIARIAKGPLRQRIKILAESPSPERRELATAVFHLALQADLFGRSRILESTGAAILIEQAIGYVENVRGEENKIQVSLVERLVVDAVLEYLQDTKAAYLPNTTLFDKLTDEYIFACQYEASAFGFLAEEYLAKSVFGKALAKHALEPRQAFLSEFDQVHRISARFTLQETFLGVEGFVLEHNPEKLAMDLSGTVDVHKWLQHVRENRPRPTFLLPSKLAGPDILFVLRTGPEYHPKRLICAVQLKTGKDVRVDQKVLRTIDPDQWYVPKVEKPKRRYALVGKRKDFLFEWERCKNKNLELLSILFLAGNQSAGVDKIEIIKKLCQVRASGQDFVKLVKEGAEKRRNEAQEKLAKVGRKRARKPEMWEKQEKDANKDLETLGSLKRTDFHLKILADNTVASIFGPVFARILRGIKIKIDDEQRDEGEDEQFDEQYDEDDEGSPKSDSDEGSRMDLG